MMRLGVWSAFQSVQLTREMPNSAGFDPWKPGLGLHFHPPTATCQVADFCAWRLALDSFKNRTGYFNRLVEADVTAREVQAVLTIWV